MNVIERILEEAQRKGMTQSGLERAAGLAAARIAKWKSGVGEPSFSEAIRIASVLGVSLNHLAGLHDEPRLDDDERAIMLIVRSIGAADSIRRLTAPTLSLPQSSSAGSTRVK